MRFASLAVSLVVGVSGAALAASGDQLVVTGDGVNVRAGPTTSAGILLQAHRNDLAVELQRNGHWVQVRLPDRNAQGWIHDSLLGAAEGAAAPAPAPAEPAPAPATAAALPPTAAALPPTAAAPPPTAAAPPPTAAALPPTAAASPPTAAAPPPTAAAPPPTASASSPLAVGGTGALARFRDSVTHLNDRAVAAAGIDLFTDVKEGGAGVVQVTATDAWKTVPAEGQDSFMRTLFDRWSAAAGDNQPLRVEVVDRSGNVLKEKSAP